MQIFNETSFWYRRITNPVIHPDSIRMVEEMVAKSNPVSGKQGRPTINAHSFSSPLYIVEESIPKSKVTITKPHKLSLKKRLAKGIRIPVNAQPARGTDGHLAIWDRVEDVYAEFWRATRDENDNWSAPDGGVIDKASMSNGIIEYPYGATATGLPVVAGMMLLDDLERGVLPYVLRMAIFAPRKKPQHVLPANRGDGWSDKSAIPEGTMFFLPSNTQVPSNAPPLLKMIIQAVKDYGLVISDMSGCHAFYGEDPTQYGLNPYKYWINDMKFSDIAKLFPWERLKALQWK